MGYVLGIDPGLDGALALHIPGTDEYVVKDMPTLAVSRGKSEKREVDIQAAADLLSGFHVCGLGIDHAFIERVHNMPKQGGSSIWSFSASYHIVLAILAAYGVPVTRVTPQAWKSVMKLPSGATKDDSRKRALEVFPTCGAYLKRKMDHGRAEALLILAYGLTQPGV